MLDIIGLPIEALNIDEHHSTYIVTVDDVCEKIGNKKLIAVSDNEKQAMKTCEHQQALVKKFSDERGRYKNDMMSLAFDIIQTIRTLRADAHGLEVITHGERQRMREEGTEVRNFDSMAGNKEKLKGYAYTSEINFRDTFREAFHRSANEIVYRIDFDTVVSGLEHMFFTDGNEKRFTTTLARQSFNTKGTKMVLARQPPNVFSVCLNTGISIASKRTCKPCGEIATDILSLSTASFGCP